ncbi:hypothetical protein [Niveispirillum cyanobacteriorum]|uniref:Uncharacterized protein n=1 Tax=Niveispirillum cyanobacteriorum TaxID=1612173 RepID=A0A2K9NKI1_9PROT|nr:hypothetical protein [Niveispirillum cyanobacteriorum]AUN33136.1 hypothetical protein C0V82_22350 [Niveispirillum cyanobacteriorum]GGE51408.1 hypothetical protein GCM10011317_07200 [Niveispirillum cyanobacteriorum]
MPANRNDKGARRSLPLELLERLRDLDRDVSLKEALALLYVAENDGISLSELRWIMRDTPSTVSRIICRLGAGLDGKAGLYLIEQSTWAHDARVRCLHLTQTAQLLLDSVWQQAGASLWWNGNDRPPKVADRSAG